MAAPPAPPAPPPSNGSCWLRTDSAQLLADVRLGGGGATAGGGASWCPINGLLAVGTRAGPDLAHVHITSVHCLERNVTLAVPLQGAWDDLVAVAWSPAGCKRLLLTATRSGRVSAWHQPTYKHLQQQGAAEPRQLPLTLHQPFVTIKDWACQEVAQLPGTPAAAGAPAGEQAQQPSLLGVQWLAPPPCWPPPGSSSTPQADEFASGSILNMFAPAAPRPRRRQRRSSSSSAAATPQEDASTTLDPAADVDGQWVQPGLPAFVALLSSGQAVVGWGRLWLDGKLRWATTARMALAQQPRAPLLAASAVCGAEGVQVAYAVQDAPTVVHVALLCGNPMHAQHSAQPGEAAALSVQHLASCALAGAAAGSSVTSVAWHPGSQGLKLAAALGSSSGASGGQLVLLRLADLHLDECSLTQDASVAVPAAPTAQQQLVWLHDGLLCAAPTAAAAPPQLTLTLHHADTLAASPTAFPAAGGAVEGASAPVLQAVAASPHGFALAAVLACPSSSSSSSRVVLLNVPPPPWAGDTSDMAPLLAGRLLWALLQQQHKWDLVPHVLLAVQPPPHQQQGSSSSGSSGVAAGIARLAEVLALVDRKVGAQNILPQSYLEHWDGLKLALLAATPGDEARCVSIDLRLRKLAPLLKHLGEALRLEELKAAQHQQQQQAGSSQQLPARGRAITQSLTAALLEFEAACLKTWLTRRAYAAQAAATSSADAAATAAAAAASAARVPCMRHLLDVTMFSDVASTYNVAQQLAPLPRPADGGASGLQLIQTAFNTATTARRQELAKSNWEEVLTALLPGPFQLLQFDRKRCPDYMCSLTVPPEQLLTHMDGVPGWKAVPVLSDADITAEATRLGLLPARTPKAKELYYHERRQHARFRRQQQQSGDEGPPSPAQPIAGPWSAAAGGGGEAAASTNSSSSTTTRLSAIKRRVWEHQIAAAMGDPLAPGLTGAASVIDLAHFVWADTAGPLLQSADGASLAVEGTPSELLQPQPGAGSRLPAKTTLMGAASAWALACPITNEVWLRTCSDVRMDSEQQQVEPAPAPKRQARPQQVQPTAAAAAAAPV